MTEWKTYKLGDLCKISSSKRIFAKEYKDSGIPFYRGKEIIEKQKGNKISTELYISQERYEEIKTKHGVPKKGDMLLTSVGTLGIPYIVQDEVFYFKDGNLTWFYNFEGLDNRYLYYWFLSPIGKMNIDSKAIGSTQKALTIETLSKFEISLPPLEEQRRIAGILGAIDDKIENNRRINTNLESQAQALFEEIFFSDNDWEYTTLGMLTEEVKTKVSGMDAKVLSPISSGELVLSEDYFTKQVYSQDTSKYIVVEPKTFAYNPARINIGSIGINSFDFIGCVSPVYVVFKTKSEYENYFRLFVKSDIFKEEVKSRAIGGVRQTLSYRDFAMITTKHPPIESIRTFNDQYNTLLDIINHNNTENRVLATLRDTLLPKLMNGEIKTDE